MGVVWDTLRYANWLHNGMPTGTQDVTTTEDGAYTLTPAIIAANSVTREPGARVFLPSEDEWYKAVYYDSVGATYFEFPTGTDVPPTCTLPTLTPNTGNCGNVISDVTPVGSYLESASPYGTTDQGGDVWEWNEQIITGTRRGYRAGGYSHAPVLSGNQSSSIRPAVPPTDQYDGIGFRVARTVPTLVPAVGTLGSTTLAGFMALVSWLIKKAPAYRTIKR